MVNPHQEIPSKKRYILILAEVKEKKSREDHQQKQICQYSYLEKAVPLVLVQKLAFCTNKL